MCNILSQRSPRTPSNPYRALSPDNLSPYDGRTRGIRRSSLSAHIQHHVFILSHRFDLRGIGRSRLSTPNSKLRTSLPYRLPQRLVDVFRNIVHVFEADGEADIVLSPLSLLVLPSSIAGAWSASIFPFDASSDEPARWLTG
jgi:hypothetical protein